MHRCLLAAWLFWPGTVYGSQLQTGAIPGIRKHEAKLVTC